MFKKLLREGKKVLLVEEKKEERISLVLENKGEKLFGILHTPKGERAQGGPLVIIFHGYASSKVGTQRSHVKMAQALASHGISAFRFDFRGSGDSEGDLGRCGFDDLLSDAHLVTSHFREQGYSNIGFFGSSLGGSIAILVASEIKEIKAIATWAPVASGELWARDFLSRSPGANSLSSYRGEPISSKFQFQFLKMKAYQTLASCSHIPFLHLQGEMDETLSLEHRRAFEAARKDAAAPSRFLLYPEISHSMGKAACFPEVIKESLSWFESYTIHQK